MADFLSSIRLPELPRLNPSLASPNNVNISMPIHIGTITGGKEGADDTLSRINKGLKDIGIKLNLK